MIRTTYAGLRQIGKARRGSAPLAKCRSNVMGSPLRMDECLVNAQVLQDTPAKQVLPVAQDAAFVPPSAMKTSPVRIGSGATFISPDVFNEIPQYGPAVQTAPPQYAHPLNRRGLGLINPRLMLDGNNPDLVPGRPVDVYDASPDLYTPTVTSPAQPPSAGVIVAYPPAAPAAPGAVNPADPNTVLTTYPAARSGETLRPLAASGDAAVSIAGVSIDPAWLLVAAVAAGLALFGGGHS